MKPHTAIKSFLAAAALSIVFILPSAHDAEARGGVFIGVGLPVGYVGAPYPYPYPYAYPAPVAYYPPPPAYPAPYPAGPAPYPPSAYAAPQPQPGYAPQPYYGAPAYAR